MAVPISCQRRCLCWTSVAYFWPPVSWWTWARWPSRSKIMMSSAGPSIAVKACGVMVANSAASPVSTVISRFAERQAHPSLDDEEPVVTGVDPLLRRPAGRFEPHLDGDRVAGRPAQHPGCPFARAVRHRADDHIVVAAHVEECVEVDLEGSCQRQQDVEADRPLAGLDPADGRRTEVGAGGELVERQAERVPKAPQPGRTTSSISLSSAMAPRLSLANIAKVRLRFSGSTVS